MSQAKIYNFIKEIAIELKYLLYAFFVYIDLDIDIFKILTLFMIIDTLTGAIKVLIWKHKEFTMKYLIIGLFSKFWLLILPALTGLLLKAIGRDFGIGLDVFLKLLVVSEFISFTGNIYTIKTGEEVKDIDIFSLIFKAIRKKAILLLMTYFKTNFNENILQDEETKEIEKKNQ